MTDKSTCSSGGRLARTSPLPENGWDLTVSAASSLLTLYDYALKLEQGGYCGKMSPRHYQATTEKISQDLFLSSAAGTSPHCGCSAGQQIADAEQDGGSYDSDTDFDKTLGIGDGRHIKTDTDHSNERDAQHDVRPVEEHVGGSAVIGLESR